MGRYYSGAEAIEMVKLRHARMEPYDLILVDWKMPEMDGIETTRRIRALDREDAKSIPIIALTANAFDEDVQRSLQAGLNAHLSKPLQPEVLFETLENMVKDYEETGRTKHEENFYSHCQRDHHGCHTDLRCALYRI